MNCDFHLILASNFRFKSGILIPEFVILIILSLDHGAEFFFFLVVPEEVVLEVPGFGLNLSVFCLPVVDLPLQSVVSLLHLCHQLFVLVDLELVILVVVYLCMEF